MTLDLSNRLLRRDQEAQYRAAVRLRNDFEHRFHALRILHRAYTCQGIFRIREKIASGSYNSASEVVREALRLLEQADQFRALKMQKLREDIRESLDSGPSTMFDPKKSNVSPARRSRQRVRNRCPNSASAPAQAPI
ncbi:MAG TPA: type II toxin-antitoxin system ParD family antitoxin [Candidatus Limnocylindria bacterium]|nr:type II toxin-antitoxin system ParD family antitoxin [Candidatus Limnocylindria bacterium]